MKCQCMNTHQGESRRIFNENARKLHEAVKGGLRCKCGGVMDKHGYCWECSLGRTESQYKQGVGQDEISTN